MLIDLNLNNLNKLNNLNNLNNPVSRFIMRVRMIEKKKLKVKFKFLPWTKK